MLILLMLQTPDLSAEEPDREEAGDWNLDFSFQQYLLPSQADLSTPVIGLTYNDVLLEARYNYEGDDATSLWLGRTFSFGQSWEFELTPMLGGVFGSIQGMAPGMKVDVSWRKLNLYSEMEYVFDFRSHEENFFYSWSELTVGVFDWLRLGVVGNRTRAYDSAVELDRGPMVRVEFESVSLSCVVLNVDEDATVVLGAEFSLGS